jgi:hypothetical protein
MSVLRARLVATPKEYRIHLCDVNRSGSEV